MPRKSTSVGRKTSSGSSAKKTSGKTTASAARKKSTSSGRSSTVSKSKSAKAGSTATPKKRTAAGRSKSPTKKSTPRKPKAAPKKKAAPKSAVKKAPAKKGTVKKKATKTTVVKAKRKPAGKVAPKKKATKTAGKGTTKKTPKPAAKKVTKKTPAKPAAKKTPKRSTKKSSARKVGVLKKVAKAFRKSRKKKTAPRPSSLHKVLASHGVEAKAPAVRPPFPAYRGTMPYIFISYSHADMKEVFRIIKQLNTSRYRIWFDEGIEPGNEWPEVVGRAVLECSQFVVFMSPTAVDSRNVRNEINLATSADKNIIVIYLKSTPLSEGLLLQIGTVQSFNKFEMPDKEFVDKLKRVLSNDLHN